MTYDEYVAAELETPVTIQAYVQAKQSYYAEQGTVTVYLQDQDGGYFAYDMACAEEDYDKLTEGTCIQVSGYKTEWSGEVEIADGTFTFVEDAEPFVAEPRWMSPSTWAPMSWRPTRTRRFPSPA